MMFLCLVFACGGLVLGVLAVVNGVDTMGKVLRGDL